MGFAHDGTKTYFNDQNFMELPNGLLIPFVAGPRHYGLVVNSRIDGDAMSVTAERQQTTISNHEAMASHELAQLKEMGEQDRAHLAKKGYRANKALIPAVRLPQQQPLPMPDDPGWEEQ